MGRMNETPYLARLQDAIRQAETERDAAQAELEATARDLALAPTDQALIDAMARIDVVIAAANTRLGHLATARHAAAKADGADARAERRKARKALRKRIDALAAGLRTDLDALIEHAQAFGPMLAAYGMKTEDLSALCRAFVRPTEQGKPYRTDSATMVVQALVLRGPAASLLRDALWRAGLGRSVGLHLDLDLDLTPYDGRSTMAEQHKRLARLLDEAQVRLDEADRVVGDAIDPPPPVERVHVVATERAFVGVQLVEPGDTVAVAVGDAQT